MKTIRIHDKNNILCGEIYPDYGGMLGHLRYRGKDILYLDEQMLPLSPLLAGGCPVLFPFPSKTAEDHYRLNGRDYSMPFHGLVKYGTFAAGQISEESASIYTTGSEVTKKENYPFDFKLTLTYKIENESTLLMQTCVENLSDTDLPHYFGWHPYFSASVREDFKLAMDFENYIDYSDGQCHLAPAMPSFNSRTDYLFNGKKGSSMAINNTADGYRVLMTMDEPFKAIIVCTRFDNCICVEPWMGLPDSINSGRFVQWVKPHSYKEYNVGMKITEIYNG